ncbi:MAG TPA: 3'-5' exonuclease, partial [Verrucomicrobiae bacterium]
KAAANDLQPSPGSSSGAATAPDLSAKVSRFLDRFARWRRIARQVALSRCLETVLAETQYADWVATQPRGEQRRANLKRLLLLAQRFDLMQRQGLFRFLRFVEAQRRVETEPELRAVNVANAVRLMSIHQSKGLEFPVVVLADLGKPFNLADLGSEIILDERYGLCPQVKPPQTGKRYPSLPHWLAARRQKRELLGEELRLLYVALTRAKDLLILSASVSRQSFGLWWSLNENAPSPQLDKARSLSDWLGAWFCQTVPQPAPPADEGGLVRWTINDDRALAASGANARRDTEAPATIQELAPDAWKELERRFARAYPFTTSTRLPAKTSVSVLRQRVIPGEDDQGRSVPFAPGLPGTSTVFPRRSRFQAGRSGIPDGITAAEVGTAHHKFLQLVDLDRTLDAEHLRHEAERLVRTGALKAEYPGLLDFKAVGRFWNSSLGHRIRAQSAFVKRELPFTFRLGAADFALLTREPPGAVAPDDFVVVQGVADLAVIRPQEIWLVDFKTDRITQEEALAANGYEQQLKLYARGLSLIYRRPVTEAWLHYLSIDHSVPVAVG